MPEEEVLRTFLPLIRGAVLVGHHVRFDAQMLDAALRRRFNIRLRNPLIDTALMAMEGLEPFHRSGYVNQPPPSLEDVCAHCEIPMVERHTAAGDAFTTAEVFLLLCARLRQRVGRPLRAGDLSMERL